MNLLQQLYYSRIVLVQEISIPLPWKVFWFEFSTPIEIPVKRHTFL